MGQAIEKQQSGETRQRSRANVGFKAQTENNVQQEPCAANWQVGVTTPETNRVQVPAQATT